MANEPVQNFITRTSYFIFSYFFSGTIPKEARYLSRELIDYDTIPLIGFPFIHWLAANVPVTNEIPEDFSRTALKPTIQGKIVLLLLWGNR